jgi:hypothetical protein
MARRKKPPAWDSVAELLPLPEAMQQRIVQGLKTVLEHRVTPACIAEVLYAGQSYLTTLAHIEHMPSLADQKRWLQDMQHIFNAALEVLYAGDDQNRTAFAQASGYSGPQLAPSVTGHLTAEDLMGIRTPAEVLDGLEDIESLLTEYAQRAAAALPELSRKKGGPTPTRARAFYIRRLAEIYERATGEKATSGKKFLQFVDAGISPIAQQQSTEALRKAIQKVLASPRSAGRPPGKQLPPK